MCKSPICSFNHAKLLFAEAWASPYCENQPPELFTMSQYINPTILIKVDVKSQESNYARSFLLDKRFRCEQCQMRNQSDIVGATL